MSTIKNKIKKGLYAILGKSGISSPADDSNQAPQQFGQESRGDSSEQQEQHPQNPPPPQANLQSCPSSTPSTSSNLPPSSSSSFTKNQSSSKSSSFPSTPPTAGPGPTAFKIMEGNKAAASSAGASTAANNNGNKKSGGQAGAEAGKIGITCANCSHNFVWDVVDETTKGLCSNSGIDPRITCPKCKKKLCHFCKETNLRRPNRNYQIITDKGTKVSMCCKEGHILLLWAVFCGIKSQQGSEEDQSDSSTESPSKPAPRRSSRLIAKDKAKRETQEKDPKPYQPNFSTHPSKNMLKILFNGQKGTGPAPQPAPVPSSVGFPGSNSSYTPINDSLYPPINHPYVMHPLTGKALGILPKTLQPGDIHGQPKAPLLDADDDDDEMMGFGYYDDMDDEDLDDYDEALQSLAADDAAMEEYDAVMDAIMMSELAAKDKDKKADDKKTTITPGQPSATGIPSGIIPQINQIMVAKAEYKVLSDTEDEKKKALVDHIITLSGGKLDKAHAESLLQSATSTPTASWKPLKHKLSPESNKDWRRGVGYGSTYFGDVIGIPWNKRRRMAISRKPRKRSNSKANRVTELYFRALAILLRDGKGSRAEFDAKCKYGKMLACMVGRSPLLSMAKDLLRNTSITDMSNSLDLYDGLMEFVLVASQQPLTLCTMTDPILLYPWEGQLLSATGKHMMDGQMSLLGAIEMLRTEYVQYRQATSNGKGKGTQTPIIEQVESCASVVKLAADSFRGFIEDAKRHQDVFKDAKDRKLVAILDKYVELAQFYKYQDGDSGDTAEPGAMAVNEGPKAVAEVEDGQLRKSYYYNAEADKIVMPSGGRMKKLLTDLNSLRADLPPGIYVRHGSDRIDMIKVLIVGPQGTPYENGLFEFDMLIPADFPSNPPKMWFKTTGGGRVCFNPNLYANGNICLSLLNTWSGPRWQRDSTLLQLLLSIQAMVLCEEPWYNEPGYERRPDSRASQAKNRDLQGHTIEHAMIPWLAHVKYATEQPRGRRAVPHASSPSTAMTVLSLKAVPSDAEAPAAQPHNVKVKKEPEENSYNFGAAPKPPTRNGQQADIWDDVVRHHFSNAEAIMEAVNQWEGKRFTTELADIFRQHHFME